LFHRAIAQSGSAVTSMPAGAATQSTEALMSRLGLKGNQVEQLQTIPVQQLLDALAPRNGTGERAAQGGGRGRPSTGTGRAPSTRAGQATSGGFNAAPVVDGTSLPYNVFDPTASTISQDVPLLIGSTETEVTWNVNTDYTVPSDDAALRERVKR